jgi:hypothetical protein
MTARTSSTASSFTRRAHRECDIRMKSRIRALVWLFVASGISQACHDPDSGMGFGANCSSQQDCREPYLCRFGSCRAQCEVDRDCPGGACLVIDAQTRVCTVPGEQACTPAEPAACGHGLTCAIDHVCRNDCASRSCGGSRQCIEGACFDEPPPMSVADAGRYDGAALPEGGASNDATADVDADFVKDANVTPDGAQTDSGMTTSGDARRDAVSDATGNASRDAREDAVSDAASDTSHDVRDAREDAVSDADGATNDVSVGPTDSGTGFSRASFLALPYRVVEAEQSAPLSSIVMISDNPVNALHIFDTTMRTDRAVALPGAPRVLAVNPSGTHAAAVHDATVSWVDLRTGSIERSCSFFDDPTYTFRGDVFDVALSDQGIVYKSPFDDSYAKSLDLTSCTEGRVSGPLDDDVGLSHLALNPTGESVFFAIRLNSGGRILTCDLTQIPIACGDLQGHTDFGTWDFCWNLWVSAEGNRIYTACGVTLRLPPHADAGVATYGGTPSALP